MQRPAYAVDCVSIAGGNSGKEVRRENRHPCPVGRDQTFDRYRDEHISPPFEDRPIGAPQAKVAIDSEVDPDLVGYDRIAESEARRRCHGQGNRRPGAT